MRWRDVSSLAILRNISIGRRPTMRRRSSFIINPEIQADTDGDLVFR